MIDPNKTCYIFDVDGTLTEPREEMTKEFVNEFLFWSMQKQCFISTGSDFEKTKQQVPWEVLEQFDKIFCCMGNEIRDCTGSVLYASDLSIPDSLSKKLTEFLEKTNFNYRTGNHLEHRTGMLNFSIVGRDASPEQRKEYNSWDDIHMERARIAEFINHNYPDYDATVGGSISIDIIKSGQDKGQTVAHLKEHGARKIVFVGDRCFPGGNDYGIIRELKTSDLAFEWYNVSGPKETLSLLRTNKVFNPDD